jgi:hypothetical protein
MSEDGPLGSSFVEFQRKEQANLAEILGRSPTTLSRSDCETLAALFNGAFIGLRLQWTLDPTVDRDAGIDALGRLIRQTAVDAKPGRRMQRSTTGRAARREIAPSSTGDTAPARVVPWRGLHVRV